MNVGYWRVKFVERPPRGEKEFELADVLTVATLRVIWKQDPSAINHLLDLLAKVIV